MSNTIFDEDLGYISDSYLDFLEEQYKDDEEKIIRFPISSSEVNMKDKKCDYKTLAIMTLYSSKNKYEDHRYIYKNHILLNKDEIESLSKNKINTVCRNIKKLCKLSNGLIEAKNTENGIVYLINYKDENNRKYVIIEEKILRLLLDGCSSNTIKTYILLKYRCATGETKITRADIAGNIGLSVNSESNLTTITNIILILERLNLIKVKKQYEVTLKDDGITEQVAQYNFFKLTDYDKWIEWYEKIKKHEI